MPRLLTLLALVFLARTAHAGGYQDALAAYQANDYATCARDLDALHASGKHSPESWLMAGNARAKLGDEPAAILAWRRALLLDPRLSEARQNLAVLVARNGIPEPAPPGQAMTMLAAIPRAVPLVAGSIGLWLAVLGGTGMFLAAKPALKSLATASLATGLLASTAGATTAYAQYHVTRPSGPLPPRVWLADGQLSKPAALRSAPARRAESILENLPAGTQLRLLQQSGWSYVEVPGGSGQFIRGWVQPDSWLPLWPFDDRLLDGIRPGPRGTP
jgi:tetratricopeptide (TPR) repeat protein